MGGWKRGGQRSQGVSPLTPLAGYSGCDSAVVLASAGGPAPGLPPPTLEVAAAPSCCLTVLLAHLALLKLSDLLPRITFLLLAYAGSDLIELLLKAATLLP